MGLVFDDTETANVGWVSEATHLHTAAQSQPVGYGWRLTHPCILVRVVISYHHTGSGEVAPTRGLRVRCVDNPPCPSVRVIG